MVNHSPLRHLLVSALCFLILICISSAINITSSISILNESVNDFDTSSNLTANLRPGIPVCSNIIYGDGLDWHSCRNAWTKIPRTTDRIAYGARNYRGFKDFTAPIRYLSDDGLCAIDITLSVKRDHTSLAWDVTTGLDLSERGDDLLDQCVKFRGEGGAVRDYCTCNLLHCAFQISRRCKSELQYYCCVHAIQRIFVLTRTEQRKMRKL